MAKKKLATEKSVEQQREEFFAREQKAYDERMKPTTEIEEEKVVEETTETEEIEVETETVENTEGEK